MKLNTLLGLAAGKTSATALKMLGRGSTLPGKLALKFDPHILDQLAKDYEIVLVTGTNGKTLTTSLIVGILSEAFGQVLTNTSGANMITGITTTFLKTPQKNGKKIAVLEVDEASVPKICDYIQPSLFVLSNIFRDQMDRFGEIYTTYQFILDGIKKAPEATILVNGDSPIFQSVDLPNPVLSFGFDHKEEEAHLAHYNTEGILCPKCQHILRYKMITYANLGNYFCPNCSFARKPLDYRLTELVELTEKSSRFRIDDQEYSINIGGLYNIYNALAAVAVAEFYQIPAETIRAGFDKSKAVFGRQETFNIGDKECTLVLIKNPVGATQALEMIQLAPGPFTMSFLLNANYADGIDTSWIWDAEFERIQNMDIPQVFTGGVRHAEISRRIRVAGYPANQMTELDQLKDLVEAIQQQEAPRAYILATYTAMLEMRELLANQHLVSKEMK
ncbi:Mur ligase family protein [Streptococcus danieliae]|uniref:Lipid II isoglutaminyl synthase (glutamine-hydrolyzing) subunit MurT n=1 Tax=Streptococcus danieliae TaxID=747656 RepID=A0A7Z0LDQ7_9STRE|nr:Mur ligase family protein [Streptococcus danieliae]MBF0717528.1 Mur ligase family protein [Streptococcus danieliae]NYS49458.1 Mur ligase family protein [Streptococcus danieliae]